MYNYSEFDDAFIKERNYQFRNQVKRRVNGDLTEDEFKPLRLMNGLYLQLHAYMLRVAIPYGTLNSSQMNKLAMIADRWDKGYGHFTTRQNIQFNWPKLTDVPDILDALAEVKMHAIQTSGNTIRNVTADHFSGAAADEVEDPRPYAELIRQWSTDHPEFQFLPRKFKVSVTGSKNDRAVIHAHDIGLRVLHNDGKIGFQVIVGGGLGRTPMIGKVINSFLPEQDLLPYLEAIVSVWNILGRRDNKYKSRIKITVHEHGIEKIREIVDERFAEIKRSFSVVNKELFSEIKSAFLPSLLKLQGIGDFEFAYENDALFRSWVDTNTHKHKSSNYIIASISLKNHGETPGDATSDQMRMIADIAQRYSHDEIRISHEQNIILPHVHKSDLTQVFSLLKSVNLNTANIGLISDIIACPGMDYCALATARSIPIAQEIAMRFDDLKLEHKIGHIQIKISGCINACGHHHVGHIGILGLDRAGVENYQITLGGSATEATAIGERAGPGFSASTIVPAIEKIILFYLKVRLGEYESFIQTYRRLGLEPFKKVLYPSVSKSFKISGEANAA
ncbi:nitrite/sulfite reductase [Amylibacter sp.]|nr:nitrite/sulfite reductase [Amylibacter sp.]